MLWTVYEILFCTHLHCMEENYFFVVHHVYFLPLLLIYGLQCSHSSLTFLMIYQKHKPTISTKKKHETRGFKSNQKSILNSSGSSNHQKTANPWAKLANIQRITMPANLCTGTSILCQYIRVYTQPYIRICLWWDRAYLARFVVFAHAFSCDCGLTKHAAGRPCLGGRPAEGYTYPQSVCVMSQRPLWPTHIFVKWCFSFSIFVVFFFL